MRADVCESTLLVATRLEMVMSMFEEGVSLLFAISNVVYDLEVWKENGMGKVMTQLPEPDDLLTFSIGFSLGKWAGHGRKRISRCTISRRSDCDKTFPQGI